MISTLKNKEGLCYGLIEWQILDAAGFQVKDGEYIFVRTIWVHKRFRSKRAYQELIDKIDKHPYSQKSVFVYWQRLWDSNGKKIIDEENREFAYRKVSKIFKREEILNKIFNKELLCS